MSAVQNDMRPASVAVQEAANVLMRRWTEGCLGGGEATDAALLQMLNGLDVAAEVLAGMEATYQRRGCGGRGAAQVGLALMPQGRAVAAAGPAAVERQSARSRSDLFDVAAAVLAYLQGRRAFARAWRAALAPAKVVS